MCCSACCSFTSAAAKNRTFSNTQKNRKHEKPNTFHTHSIFACRSIDGQNHGRRIDCALALAEAAPDSAIRVLNNIDKSHLHEYELARYTLAYTWAQDKSGLDVADDSLIRIAFDYYDMHRQDSLYPRCAYYMGKYYYLVDSTEQAKQCFDEAVSGANRIKDIKTECLASEKLSWILRTYYPPKAEALADNALKLYMTVDNPSQSNIFYYLLNYSICATFNKHYKKAESTLTDAMQIALEMNDSASISVVYQDMAFLYSETKRYNNALMFVKKALRYKPHNEKSCLFALSSAYVNVDSTEMAKKILDKIDADKPLEKYSKYYNLLSIHISEGNKMMIKACADSALGIMESLYTQSSLAKDKHYSTVIEKERERSAMQSASAMKTRLIAALVVLSLAIITFILYVLHINKKNAKRRMFLEKEHNELRLKHERERSEMELRHEQKLRIMANKLHAKELSNKEAQLTTMRRFLLKKIDISRKIEEIKQVSDKHILIDEEEWSEIEVLLEGVDNLFVSRLRARYPELAANDIRLFMLLRLKMPARSLALIYGISEKAIKQKLFLYKMKVNLCDNNTSLRAFIEAF